MFPNPNPVAAAQQVARDLRAHAAPKPKPVPEYPDWWGKRCDFIYSLTTLADWPAVPIFKESK